jgi:hypothetical protein
VANPSLLWPPGVALGLSVGIAQVGIQLVFFLRITVGPDDINNVLAPAFGILIGILMVAGSRPRQPDHCLPETRPANLFEATGHTLSPSRLEGSGIGSLCLFKFEVRQLRARVAKPAKRCRICVPVPGAALP